MLPSPMAFLYERDDPERRTEPRNDICNNYDHRYDLLKKGRISKAKIDCFSK